MKRVISIVFVLMLLSLVSAEIIINEQPKELYNLGEGFSVPVTIKTTEDVSDIFDMNLICNGQEMNFYKNGVFLLTGEEKKLEPSLILTTGLIGNLKGTCKVKGSLGEDYVLSEDFEISDEVIVSAELGATEINPGEELVFEGNAIRKSGKELNGFLDVEIIENNSVLLSKKSTINKGYFSEKILIPEDFESQKYLLKLVAYEVDSSDEVTNSGFASFNIFVKQEPTSLELVMEEEIEPGTNLNIRPILHDQTGKNIEKQIKLTVKNNYDEIVVQTSVPTDEVFNQSIKYNEPSAEWDVIAEFQSLKEEKQFRIVQKQDIGISIVNDTILIKNTGNIPYNKSVSVKIGEEDVPIEVYLEVDETKEYQLKAPDGTYKIEVQGEDKSITASSFLTGRAIDVREPRKGFIRHTLAWFFIILVLGMATFMLFRKSRKRTFFGYMPSFKKKKPSTEKMNLVPVKKDALLKTRHHAESSLSIKGDKQTTSLVCLKIKNLKEIESKKSGSEETLQKVVDYAEKKKAYIYQNGENIFFILAPTITKTFKNEPTALEIAKHLEDTLKHHNKFFKQKLEFGISLNNGSMVVKKEDNVLKFMSMGTTTTMAKKLANKASSGILLTEGVKDKLRSNVKEEKVDEGIYRIKEYKENKEESKKFIENFVRRQKEEHKEKSKK